MTRKTSRLMLLRAIVSLLLAGCSGGGGASTLPAHETAMASPTYPASAEVAPTPTTASETPTPLALPSGMPTPGAGLYVGILDQLEDIPACLGAWIRQGPGVPESDWFELVLAEPYGWTSSEGLLAIKDADGLIVAREFDWVLIAGRLDPAAGSFCMAGRQLLARQIASYGSAPVPSALPIPPDG